MSETNEIAKNLYSILESLNMKSTADSFKLEFSRNLNKNKNIKFFTKENFGDQNKLENNELFKTLYTKINELNHLKKQTPDQQKLNRKKQDQINKEKNEKMQKNDSQKVLNNLADKLLKKFDPYKIEEMKNENELMKTKMFMNLVKKYSNNQEETNEDYQRGNKVIKFRF